MFKYIIHAKWRVYVVLRSLHTKNRVERLFELIETFQFLTASVLPPHVSDQINPPHLVVAEILTSKPLVNCPSLLYVLIVRQGFPISMILVEEVDKCCQRIMTIRAVRQLIQCGDNHSQLNHMIIFTLTICQVWPTLAMWSMSSGFVQQRTHCEVVMCRHTCAPTVYLSASSIEVRLAYSFCCQQAFV